VLIDNDPEALRLAEANLGRIGAPANVRLLPGDASRLGSARGTFDLAFLDPPYRSGLAPAALTGLRHGWLAPGARIIVELGAKEPFEPPDGYVLEQERRYGAAKLVLLRVG
jgi:16S rRNA (guanine966-N2)-methyltransferase